MKYPTTLLSGNRNKVQNSYKNIENKFNQAILLQIRETLRFKRGLVGVILSYSIMFV